MLSIFIKRNKLTFFNCSSQTLMNKEDGTCKEDLKNYLKICSLKNLPDLRSILHTTFVIIYITEEYLISYCFRLFKWKYDIMQTNCTTNEIILNVCFSNKRK